MSLPEFKFTNLTKPSNDTTVNSGLSAKSKMVKSGIIPGIVDKAQDTASSAWSGIRNSVSDIDIDITSGSGSGSGSSDGGDGESFFSFTFIIKLIIFVAILWFMWANLANNGDFHLGMGDVGEKITAFFHKMEETGRELIAKMSGTPVRDSSDSSDSSDSDSDSDSDDDKKHKPIQPASTATGVAPATAAHRAPAPPPMNNSSDKKPGFNNNDDPKYTFLDKANREYSGPSPRADDSTSATQKHQSGKAGYCYIGEDRGFRSCAKVEAGDKCMSGEVYARQEMCIDPTLRD
jgi:hypothetical protein